MKENIIYIIVSISTITFVLIKERLCKRDRKEANYLIKHYLSQCSNSYNKVNIDQRSGGTESDLRQKRSKLFHKNFSYRPIFQSSQNSLN